MNVKIIKQFNDPKLHPNFKLLSPLDKRIIQHIWNEPENQDDFQLAESLMIPLDRIRQSLLMLVDQGFLNERKIS